MENGVVPLPPSPQEPPPKQQHYLQGYGKYHLTKQNNN